ncbi:polysaccharide deacetylase family protein [Aliiglaciecola sp. CAU 1673]|uniref:polysaccharide deacetylase family protein n=1 Tax=Aliiglaciecola sp. CAU 1673 TaxID=3032595 RepID=UPI0023DA18FE|nr:polysaccharide deacetylase family protein [Aliiglaciecola sp. CAU 1673]MDF2177303.1 polysaccharide deacetylase family protein [Aliiglaciecola sp. CAU 1673]
MLHQLISLGSRLAGKNKLSILIYHQVLERLDDMRPGEPDQEQFDWQMSLISRYFTPLPLGEAIERLQAGTLPPKAVCITFDDGYLNNLTLAAPILKRYGVPATVFVASAFSQGENMWNDKVLDLFEQADSDVIDCEAIGLGKLSLADGASRRQLAYKTIGVLKYLPVQERLEKIAALYAANGDIQISRKMMSEQEIRQLSELGIEIGAHTHNHPILKGMSPQAVREEIAENVRLLESWTGKQVKSFAYPNGKPGKDFDEHTVEVVKEFPFKQAVSTEWGVSRPGADLYRLKRFTPWDRTPLKFHLRMLLNLIKH